MSCSTTITDTPRSRIRGNDLVDLVDDARREAEADLVAEQQARIGEQRPAERDHLLLAARQLARMAVAPLVEHREPLVHLHRSGSSPLRPSSQPMRRFSNTVSDGKSLRPSGTSAIPLATMSRVAQRGKVLAVEARRAGYPAGLAHQRLEEGRLARAVGPDDRDDLPFADREVDIVHSLEGVVEDAQFFDGEERGGH